MKERDGGKVRLHRTLDMGRRGPLPRKRIQIEDWVRREIVRGGLKPGDALPSREWFRTRFTPNLNMVQRAFDELRREGFVETVPGHGSRVAASLPFSGRYLLLTRSDVRDAGTNYFAPALRGAAKALESRRGVVFDVRDVDDFASGRDAYERMMEDVRRHRYAGVVAQAANAVCDLDCVTNIDDVPMAYFGHPDYTTQGSLVKSFFAGGRDVYEDVFARHCEECAAAEAASAAVFAAHRIAARHHDRRCADMLRARGMRLAADGFHEVYYSGRTFSKQFKRLVALFLKSSGCLPDTAVILEDENFLEPFIEVSASLFGLRATRRRLVCCHANRPNEPKCEVPVRFHGLDCTATLATAVDYAEAVMAGVRRPPLPSAVLF